MPIPDLAYSSAVTLARAVTPVLGAGSSKLARSLQGRSEAGPRLVAWCAEDRDPSRPLVWFHGPSVGEGLQARAVLTALRELRPDIQSVFTHTSPSAEGLARSMDVDVADYLPWDSGGAFRGLMDVLAATAIVFSQREVWPGVAREAARLDIPVVLAAATLPEDARRIRPAARWFLEPTFARVREVLAIADPDGARFAQLGVPPDRVVVTGDPGVDSAWARSRAADPGSSHLRPFVGQPAPTVVAGSTWPADEAVLVPAMKKVRQAVSGVRLIVVPHEPTPAHVSAVEVALEADGWTARRLSDVIKRGSLSGAGAVVVDSVGVLSDLYTVGSAAVVGGAFDQTGIHSVLEPAAAGIPSAFGPHHENSRAAGELEAEGAARVASDAEGLAEILATWLTDDEARRRAGAAGRAYLERHRGASRRSAERIAALL